MRPIHFEILADNPERVAAFYEGVLGWKTSTWEGGDQEYWLVDTGSEGPGINGAIMKRAFKQAVINTVEVASVDAMVEKVKGAGGELVAGPSEVPGVGRHAYVSDPDGNIFGMMQPIEHTG